MTINCVFVSIFKAKLIRVGREGHRCQRPTQQDSFAALLTKYSLATKTKIILHYTRHRIALHTRLTRSIKRDCCDDGVLVLPPYPRKRTDATTTSISLSPISIYSSQGISANIFLSLSCKKTKKSSVLVVPPPPATYLLYHAYIMPCIECFVGLSTHIASQQRISYRGTVSCLLPEAWRTIWRVPDLVRRNIGPFFHPNCCIFDPF